MVGNWTGVENFEHLERGLRAKHHHLADVLQSEPDLISFRRRSNVWAKGRLLFHPGDDFVVGYRDDGRFRVEARADVAVLAVRRKDGHPWAIGELDAALLGKRLPIEHR